MRKFVLFVATGAGTGYAPLAPGTVGSAAAVLLWWPLRQLPPAGLLGLVAAISALGAWSAARAEVLLGRHDDPRITIDEVAGMLLSLALLPPRLDVALVGFALFRLFDITKPPPCRRLEKLGGGAGVMADDLMAGFYANVCGQILWRVVFPGGLL